MLLLVPGAITAGVSAISGCQVWRHLHRLCVSLAIRMPLYPQDNAVVIYDGWSSILDVGRQSSLSPPSLPANIEDYFMNLLETKDTMMYVTDDGVEAIQ